MDGPAQCNGFTVGFFTHLPARGSQQERYALSSNRMTSPDYVRDPGARHAAAKSAVADLARSKAGRRRRDLSTDPVAAGRARRYGPAGIVGKRMKTYRVDCRPQGCIGFFASFLAVAFFLGVVTPDLARAEGALAVGIARGGAAKGYATGFATNQPTVTAARANAIEQCRKTKSSNKEAKSGCEVVATFRNKCVASAIDPQQGTPGAGWGVGTTQESADSQALARCRAKAGAERAEFCEVTDRYCDGK
jgi:hypothetical protein